MAATVAVSVKQPSLGTKYDRWLQNVTSLRSGWKGVAEKFLEAKEIYLKEKSALEGAGLQRRGQSLGKEGRGLQNSCRGVEQYRRPLLAHFARSFSGL